jgi:flagellar basal body-associated protein FliL
LEIVKIADEKKIILAAILFFFSGIVGVSLLMFSVKKDARVDHSTEFTEVRSIHENIENLDSFVIDLRDEHGNYRVLICEITVVVNQDKKFQQTKWR